jgi:hypothetical protein
MARRKKAPSLKTHKSTGHVYARFDGRQIWFGSYPDSETHLRFATTLAEWEANGGHMSPQVGQST